MYLSRIHLINFRPFSDIVFNLQETTLITGRNGSGKTSVLEAIHVLLKSRSFRTSSINSLINREKENFILNAKLDGDLLVFDHADIDIVLMVEKKKIVAFPKDLMSEVVYGAESRLMEWMRKSGIIEYDLSLIHISEPTRPY